MTDNLNKTLQNESLSAAEAQRIARQAVTTLKNLRSNEIFQLFWKHVECLRERTDTKRRAPPRFEIGDGECYYSNTVEDHYRQIYFEALDLAITSIEDRFSQPGYLLSQNLEELLIIELQEVLSFYDVLHLERIVKSP